jgi:hypothetical protein
MHTVHSTKQKVPELSLLEIQTLDFVLQRGELQGEFCQAVVGVVVKAW